MATLTTSWKSYASASYSTGVATITFYLEAKYSSQSVANNTTAVQTRLRSAFTKGNSLAGAGYKFTCTYCSTVSGSGTWTFENEVITSGSKTVTHNNDGTKTLSLSATAYNKYWNFTKNMSATVSLPKINRIAKVTSGTNFNDEGNPTITFSNPGGMNLQPYLNWYNSSGTRVHQILGTVGQYSSPYTWNLSSSQRNAIRSATNTQTSYNVREGLQTYNGNTLIQNSANSSSNTFTIVNANPTFNATYQDTNSSIIAITGNNQKLIRNKSTLQINVTGAAAQKGASLSSIKCIINGVTYNTTLSGSTATFNIGTLNISSNTTAQVILTDSRGLQAVRNLTLQMIDWQLPNAIINMQRENNFYSTTNITVDANYSSLNNQNTITIQMRYKKTTDGSYGSYTTLQDNVTSQFTFDNNYQWNIQVLLTDRLGSTTYNLVLDRGTPLIYFDRLNNSVGINKIPSNDNDLEVDGTATITDGLYSRPVGEVNTPVGNSMLVVKRASRTSDSVPNNGVVLEFGNSTNWSGQLFIGDNSTQGIYYNGWNEGVRGNWRRLADAPVVLYSNTSGTDASFNLSEDWAHFKEIEVYYLVAGWLNNCAKLDRDANQASLALSTLYGAGSTDIAIISVVVQFSGTTVNFIRPRTTTFSSGSANVPTISASANLKITKVLGYR